MTTLFTRTRRSTILALVGATVLAGCYRPQGGLIPATGAAATYYSTQMIPKSLTVIDLRSDEVIFAMDIPPGKQLTMQFIAGEGDDPVYTPDLMIYEIFDQGTTTGKLHNSLSVPPASSRRIDIDVAQTVEYATAPSTRQLRTDELADRPDWWTPEGGKMPSDPHGLTIYDD